MRFTQRVLSFIIAIFIALSACACALAVTPADYDSAHPAQLENDHLYAESAFLIDMDTGEQLLSKNSRVRVFPASTTKIMTLLLALESNIALDRVVTIPKEAADIPQGSSVIGIKPGDQMTWSDLLYGFMLRSGNDGANAIAVLVSGTIDQFVASMNLRAMQLGCEGTHFTNAHGYQDNDHYTTAQDLARISIYAMQNETFRQIVACPRTNITIRRGGKNGTGEVENRNSLLLNNSNTYYAGANGIKTGHHASAGRCVVASAQRGTVNLIAVVMDCATEERQWADARKLLDYGFSQYVSYSMAELMQRMQEEICAVTFENAAEDDPNGGKMLLNYNNVVNGQLTRMVHNGSEVAMNLAYDDIRSTLSYSWKRDLVAPVTAGEVLGTASFTAPDGSVVTTELVATRDMQAKPEPTPTPTAKPTEEPSFDEPKGASDSTQTLSTGTHRTGSRNRATVRIIIMLLVVVLLLVALMLIYAYRRRQRKKREAARRRAAMRKRRAMQAKRRTRRYDD